MKLKYILNNNIVNPDIQQIGGALSDKQIILLIYIKDLDKSTYESVKSILTEYSQYILQDSEIEIHYKNKTFTLINDIRDWTEESNINKIAYKKKTDFIEKSDEHIKTFIWKLMSALTNSLKYKIVIKDLDMQRSKLICDNEIVDKNYEFEFINEIVDKNYKLIKTSIVATGTNTSYYQLPSNGKEYYVGKTAADKIRFIDKLTRHENGHVEIKNNSGCLILTNHGDIPIYMENNETTIESPHMMKENTKYFFYEPKSKFSIKKSHEYLGIDSCGEGYEPDTTKCDPNKANGFVCVRIDGDEGKWCASNINKNTGGRDYSTYNRIKS